MLEFFIYLIIDTLLGLIVILWLAIIALPMILLTLGLGLGIYSSTTWLISQPKAKEPLRVLMVDDNPNTLMLINNILRSRNCILKIVDSGLKAIEELNRETYDLLVLDYFMFGLNGSETLILADHIINKKIKTKSNYQIPVIEYSSYGEDVIKPATMINFAMVGKLSKSMPPSMLKPLISQILNEITVYAV
jgi:CheY-like chemotaxis protein